MKKTNKLLSLACAGAMTLGMIGVGSQVLAETYEGDLYVAGMGGHFSKATVRIDPSKDQPIQIRKLGRLEIGDAKTHPVHDNRIDSEDRGVMFWSTYKVDPNTKSTHVGKTDLATGEVIQDIDVSVPDKAQNTDSMYCGSGQDKDHFIPITMSHSGYLDVFRKSDLKQVARVFMDDIIDKPYHWVHGINTPNQKEMLLVFNEAKKDHGPFSYNLHLVLVDMASLVKGKVKVLKTSVITQTPRKAGDFIGFRADYSKDGKLVAIGAADRVLIVDAETLKLKDAAMMEANEQTHDATFTPDGKYLLATSRTGTDDKKYPLDGTLKLYDVHAQKWVGKDSSVCLSCHKTEEIEGKAVLCGIQTNFYN